MRHITINNENYPFRLSYRALKGTLRETGLKLSELDNLDLEHLSILAKEAINAGYRYEKKEYTVTLDFVEDSLDNDFSLLSQLTEAIGEEMKTMSEPRESVDEVKK